MKILTDESGFITSFALEGELVNGLEVPEPDDIEHFCMNFSAYRIRDGDLVFDSEQAEAVMNQQILEELRLRRERECFSVINRGQLWYETLTAEQKEELKDWYLAWLDVTEMGIAPDTPAWLL